VFGHRSHARAPIRPPIHQTTWQHIKDACARAELSRDIAAHSLRRGFSDAARQAGVSVTDLAEMLRNDPAVALRYQTKDPELLRRQARKISRVMRAGQAEKKVTVTGTVSVLKASEPGELNS
jgi:hypothetical protein